MLTLRALLADPTLELRLLVAGGPGALDDEVVWVHNTELPDPSPYVRERELVLTNGLWLEGERPADPAQFVANIRRASAAGVVFGLRAERTSTPPELVEACDAAGVPLLEISVRVPFTEVTRAAAAIYAEQRQSALVGMVRRGNALAAAISHGAGASGVLAVLRRDHDLPLAVVDRMGRLLAAVGADLHADQLTAAAEALARRPRPLEVELGAAGRATLFSVGAVGDADAALLCLRPVTALDRAERDALDQAARFLSLEVARQQTVQAIEQRFASELLDMILSGAHRAAEVAGRLRAFGVDPDGPLTVCAVAFRASAEPDTPTLPGMVEAITDFFLAESLPAAVAGGSQDVAAVLPWRQSTPDVPDLAARLVAALAPRFPGRAPVVGIGETASSAAELRGPLAQSREAARVLRGRRGGPDVATFGELGGYRLLLGLHEGEQLRRFADSVLGPMREHDRRRGGELETTLRAFLDHDGHWAATAAALYVHVNTLRNRLTRIAELTGRDVGRTADRADLFLALEAGTGG
ncbi:PucR family transcriptional regulator [Pseudonocardia nigra]|uniref:PucR family transcriptional regulator n=1 Tax=Pseudonocardia nigra TaxID=1921578 RepID=UPI001C5EBEF7|nr:PucR family transcriptional regulator ligand-binding domain-containing protein [Pseudonocardia nigra]